MAPAQQISNTFRLKIDGKEVPADVDVARVEVEDHLHLPDTFTLTFHDTARTAVSKAAVKIGATVEIAVLSDAQPAADVLLRGEVTAIEAELFAGASYTLVRGYDESHRLLRGRVTESYKNMTYSDVATKVAKRAKLKAGVIDPTPQTYPHITQANENDWTFLRRLGGEVGYEVGISDGKLYFRKPVSSSGAPSKRDLQADDPLLLQAGSTLLNLRAALTAADQVKDVEVRGWDVQSKKAIVATAAVKTNSIKNGTDSAAVAQAFPGPPMISTVVPYGNDREVSLAANALADEVAASCTEMEGLARGNPKLRAGAAVQVGLLGEPFDGKYVLTTTRHMYDHDEGYVTAFVVSGRQERSLLKLTAGASDADSHRINGVVPAIVDDVQDPDDQCRLRLRFPWMADKYVSDWSRIVQTGAGSNRGTVMIPEVGDEVLVSFEQGDVRKPFVIGGLYNGVDKPKLGPGSLLDSSSKAVNNRLFTSRKGHQLLFTDGTEDCGVTIATGNSKLSIHLDEKSNQVTIQSAGDMEFLVDGAVKISAGKDLELSGNSVKVKAQTGAAINGAQVSIESSGPVQVKGQIIKLN